MLSLFLHDLGARKQLHAIMLSVYITYIVLWQYLITAHRRRYEENVR